MQYSCDILDYYPNSLHIYQGFCCIPVLYLITVRINSMFVWCQYEEYVWLVGCHSVPRLLSMCKVTPFSRTMLTHCITTVIKLCAQECSLLCRLAPERGWVWHSPFGIRGAIPTLKYELKISDGINYKYLSLMSPAEGQNHARSRDSSTMRFQWIAIVLLLTFAQLKLAEADRQFEIDVRSLKISTLPVCWKSLPLGTSTFTLISFTCRFVFRGQQELKCFDFVCNNHSIFGVAHTAPFGTLRGLPQSVAT